MEDPNEVLTSKFGIFHQFTATLGTSHIHSILKINQYEYIACSKKNMIKFENAQAKKVYDIPSICATYIEKYQAIILVTLPPTQIKIYFLDDLQHPVLDNFSIDQVGVCHIIYSDKSRTLITLGLGVYTFLFEALPYDKRFVKLDRWAKITYLNKFALGYSASRLSSPCFREDTETLVLITSDGLITYDLQGKILAPAVSYTSPKFTLYQYNPRNKKAITSEVDQGFILWSKHNRMIRRYTFFNSSIFVGHFLTKEFVISVDTNFFISILDIKTEKCFPFIKLDQRPHRVFFDRTPGRPPRVIVCTFNYVAFYEVILPWRLWRRTSTKPLWMLRCPMANKAARISVLLSDASIQMYSPRNAKLLTICHTRELGFPVNILMDRGMEGVVSRDQLFVCFDNGVLGIFGTSTNPSEPVSMMQNKATCCSLSMFMGKWCLLLGTSTGEIVVYTYEKLTLWKRFAIFPEPVKYIFHSDATKSILIVYEKKTVRFSTDKGERMAEYMQPCGCKTAVLGNVFINGFNDGTFIIRTIEANDCPLLHNRERPLHRGAVTGITGSLSFFVTSGYDGSILIWTMDVEVVVELQFPLHINSCAFLNGRRGLLIGTDNEIMIVPGSSLFGKQVDPEDSLMDNFDRRTDDFHGRYMLLEEEDNAEEEDMNFLKHIVKSRRNSPKANREPVEWKPLDLPPPPQAVEFKKSEERQRPRKPTSSNGERTREDLAALEEMKALLGEKSSFTLPPSVTKKEEEEEDKEKNKKKDGKGEEDEYEDEYEEDEDYALARARREREEKAKKEAAEKAKSKKKGDKDGDDDDDEDGSGKKKKKSGKDKGDNDDEDPLAAFGFKKGGSKNDTYKEHEEKKPQQSVERKSSLLTPSSAVSKPKPKDTSADEKFKSTTSSTAKTTTTSATSSKEKSEKKSPTKTAPPKEPKEPKEKKAKKESKPKRQPKEKKEPKEKKDPTLKKKNIPDNSNKGDGGSDENTAKVVFAEKQKKDKKKGKQDRPTTNRRTKRGDDSNSSKNVSVSEFTIPQGPIIDGDKSVHGSGYHTPSNGMSGISSAHGEKVGSEFDDISNSNSNWNANANGMNKMGAGINGDGSRDGADGKSKGFGDGSQGKRLNRGANPNFTHKYLPYGLRDLSRIGVDGKVITDEEERHAPIPKYPNAQPKGRNPRTVVFREKEPIGHDIDLTQRIPPQFMFDKNQLERLYLGDNPEKLAMLQKLACFNEIQGPGATSFQNEEKNKTNENRNTNDIKFDTGAEKEPDDLLTIQNLKAEQDKTVHDNTALAMFSGGPIEPGAVHVRIGYGARRAFEPVAVTRPDESVDGKEDNDWRYLSTSDSPRVRFIEFGKDGDIEKHPNTGYRRSGNPYEVLNRIIGVKTNEELARHFCVAHPRHIEGAEVIEGNEKSSMVYALYDDPPPLAEQPPFEMRPQMEYEFNIPEPETYVSIPSRTDSEVEEILAARRSIRTPTYRNGLLRAIQEKAEVAANSAPCSGISRSTCMAKPPRVVDSAHRTSLRDLTAIFRRLRSASPRASARVVTPRSNPRTSSPRI